MANEVERSGKSYVFASCDIIAHSATPSLSQQRDNVAGINEIVRTAMARFGSGGAVWASGGDGGHVAFTECEGACCASIELLLELRRWSLRQGVNLRLVGNVGRAEDIVGADNRIQLVGPGINLAGRLLSYGAETRIILSEEFLNVAKCDITNSVHDKRVLRLSDFPDQSVFLLSVNGEFQSTWDTPGCTNDKSLLQAALARSEPLELISRAKRLFEINPEEEMGVNALRTIALRRIRPRTDHNFLYDLFLDEQFGVDIIRASLLVERLQGEVICEYGDSGTTMFLILKGRVGVHLPSDSCNPESPPPDFLMGPGELAGELAFTLHRPRTATLRCIEDCSFLVFSSHDLMAKVRQAKHGDMIASTLERKLTLRVIENIWNTAPSFRAKESQSILGGLVAPWFTMLHSTRMGSVSRGEREFNTKSIMVDEGLCVLVDGKIKLAKKGTVLDGRDYPLLAANFPNELEFALGEHQLLTELKYVMIGRSGLVDLGWDAVNEIITRARGSIAEVYQMEEVCLPKYDVFLSHNSHDKEGVRALSRSLKAAGVSYWLDEEELRPGLPWQQLLESAIRNSACIAVLVGKDGIGPWEDEEMRAALSLAVKDKRPIIPVLLPRAAHEPSIPLFLGNRTWVDLRAGFAEEGIKCLVWGITGQKPEERP